MITACVIFGIIVFVLLTIALFKYFENLLDNLF